MRNEKDNDLNELKLLMHIYMDKYMRTRSIINRGVANDPRGFGSIHFQSLTISVLFNKYALWDG